MGKSAPNSQIKCLLDLNITTSLLYVNVLKMCGSPCVIIIIISVQFHLSVSIKTRDTCSLFNNSTLFG